MMKIAQVEDPGNNILVDAEITVRPDITDEVKQYIRSMEPLCVQGPSILGIVGGGNIIDLFQIPIDYLFKVLGSLNRDANHVHMEYGVHVNVEALKR